MLAGAGGILLCRWSGTMKIGCLQGGAVVGAKDGLEREVRDADLTGEVRQRTGLRACPL
jgi:hypothetical protein